MEPVSPDRRDQARWIVLVATVAGALYLCWLMLKPFIGVLLWAAVLTLTFEPIHRRIVARTRRPALSAALTCLAVVVVVGLPTVFILWATTREIGTAIASMQQLVAELMDPDSKTTGRVVHWLSEYIDVQRTRAQVTEYLGGIGSELGSRTLN